jgi:two-component system LytT family response regulator
VFVTAYAEYAVHAFDVRACDYLLKPVEADRLAETLDRIRDAQFGHRSSGASTDCLFLRVIDARGEGSVSVPPYRRDHVHYSRG